MRQVKSIKMDDDYTIQEILYLPGNIEIIKANEYFSDEDEKLGKKTTVYNIFNNGAFASHRMTKKEANEYACKLMVSDYLVITGYGIYSECDFWEIPEKLKCEVRNNAKKASV